MNSLIQKLCMCRDLLSARKRFLNQTIQINEWTSKDGAGTHSWDTLCIENEDSKNLLTFGSLGLTNRIRGPPDGCSDGTAIVFEICAYAALENVTNSWIRCRSATRKLAEETPSVRSIYEIFLLDDTRVHGATRCPTLLCSQTVSNFQDFQPAKWNPKWFGVFAELRRRIPPVFDVGWLVYLIYVDT